MTGSWSIVGITIHGNEMLITLETNSSFCLSISNPSSLSHIHRYSISSLIHVHPLRDEEFESAPLGATRQTLMLNYFSICVYSSATPRNVKLQIKIDVWDFF